MCEPIVVKIVNDPPTWQNILQIISALGVPTIAAVGAYIARKQAQINQNRLRHELFEKRYELYAAARDLIKARLDFSEPFNEYKLTEFYIKSRECRFIIPNKDVEDYLNALHKNCEDLSTAAIILGAAETGTADDITESDIKFYENDFSRLENWLKEQPDKLLNIFEPYLKLKH